MSVPVPSREFLLPTLLSALDFAAAQARRVLRTHPGYTPMYTVDGRWNREGERWTHWCEGFFPGILWLLHEHFGDPEWRGAAERYSLPLEPRRHDRTVHDLGFLFLSTYLRWYHLTGDEHLRDVLVEAGRTLAMRRQKGGYLASFLGPQSLFIDIMMNVGLIFWAARATNDAALFDVALEHCRISARYLVRPDGGTAHEALFDPETGRFLRESTQQGWAAGSTWSRGLAWAIYGFTTAHRISGVADFLLVAQRCADFYLRRSPADLVPYWDYDLPPDAPHLRDSSAAAVAASGLWDLGEAVVNRLRAASSLTGSSGELSDLEEAVAERAEGQRYQTAALTILQTLCGDEYLPRRRPEWEGILMHGVYHFHRGLGVDESVAWGDHFFVEALVKVVAGHSS